MRGSEGCRHLIAEAILQGSTSHALAVVQPECKAGIVAMNSI
jgi:hypothetical protein